MNVERREGHFKNRSQGSWQETELFYQTWSRPGSRATLVVTHGISEHSECYSKTAAAWAELGWNTVAWDLRGHGRSEGKRGYVRRFEDYSEDLAALLRHLEKNRLLQDGNFALIGHSMGGLVTLRHLIQNDEITPKPKAVALSSPLLGVALAVPPVKDFAARVMNHVWPSLTLFNEIRYQDLTRDPEFLHGYTRDSLRHDKISPSLYLGMFETMEMVKQSGDRIETPILIQAAGQERIVSLPAIEAFFPTIASAQKKLVVYPDSYHEIYNDLDRQTVFRDLSKFLESQF